MKSLMWLLRCMLKDISIRCDTDTHRDFITISRRTEDEGLSFLTITLPNFAKDFEQSLELGRVSPDSFLGFRKKSALPALLRGLLEKVFDPVDGVLLPDPSIDAIYSIRQLCLMFKKLNMPCSPERVDAAFEGFRKCEHELAGLMSDLPAEVYDLFGKVSDVLWGSVLSKVDQMVYNFEHQPKHGPGSTAEKLLGNEKYLFNRWHTRLDEYFPMDYFRLSVPDEAQRGSHLDDLELVEPGAEQPVRVITVPKTLKSPRIIAIEPVCTQYTQQSLLGPIVDQIESHALTSGHVNFTDQSINQQLALESSKSGHMATIDLSEASDRVHKDLVYRMLKTVPHLRGAIFACRSMRANVNNELISLSKFASMGSALCFPMEAMLFYTVCTLARCIVLNAPFTTKGILYASRGVYVYGDDIIVPAEEVEAIGFALNSFGLKVNTAKSFSKGNFRESCGMDAYNGIDVTPTYCRHLPPSNRQDVPAIVSFVAFANQLYTKGWWTAAARVREHVESLIGDLPYVRDTSPCLGWTSYLYDYSYHRWDDELHRPLVRSYVVSPIYQVDRLDGYPALMKCFLQGGDTPTFEGHLERSVRSGSVRIKSRWAPPC